MKSYEIPGIPIPWKRARRCGNRYFDAQANQKELLRKIIKIADKAIYCSNKAIYVFYQFNMPIPKSWSRIRRLNAIGAFHTKTPDLDNLIKFVNDTFNKVLWADDKQIVEIHATKKYDEIPCTKITIMEVEDD